MTAEQINGILGIKEAYQLHDALEGILFDRQKRELTFEKFLSLEGDTEHDWFTDYFQQSQSDRKQMMQDYTPASIAKLMGYLAGSSDVCIDLCAGTGALTIQKWAQDPELKFELYEVDKTAISFLLFNMSIRNISCTVHHADVLSGEEWHTWKVQKGERFGKIVDI